MFTNLLVIELASVLAGPSVGMYLAELGATVIKVENLHTGGDVTRSWKLPTESPEADISAYFSSINWGKQSLAIDLKQPEGREIVYALCDQADIVLTSFLPKTAQKLGMEPDTLRKRNPSLIVGEINGYGAGEERAAYDAIIQAEAGFTYLNGEKDKGMTKMPVALMDLLAGHQLKEALLLAIIHRMKTGEGSIVSASLIESGIASLANQATNWLVAGQLPQPLGSDHPNIVPYGTIFKTKDDKAVVLAVGSDNQFQQLSDLLEIGLESLFETSQDRVIQREALHALLRSKIETWNRDDLLAALAERKVPAGAVNDMREVMDLPQVKGMKLQAKGLTGVSSVASRMGFFDGNNLTPPPHLSQDVKEVLAGRLGFSEEKIQELVEKGVIKGSD